MHVDLDEEEVLVIQPTVDAEAFVALVVADFLNLQRIHLPVVTHRHRHLLFAHAFYAADLCHDGAFDHVYDLLAVLVQD